MGSWSSQRNCFLALTAAFLFAAPASSHEPNPIAPPPARLAAIDGACPGDPMSPDRVIEGRFDSELAGSYVMVPFSVPKRATGIRVKYCFDQPENGRVLGGHTLDLGLWEPAAPGRDWGPRQFRGWGGSSHPDVTVSPRGFSSERKYLENPKGDVAGRTTRGFRPGEVPAGRWAVELGLASIISRALGDQDGTVAWRVEIDTLEDSRLERGRGYRPTPYNERPARREPGWYAGDLHVHAEHSALGDATMSEVFSHAFGSIDQGGAGLDFVTLSDYVTDTAWKEIGRYQDDYRRRLIDRSSEVITYRGHIGNHASARYVDHRTGPVYRLRSGGALKRLRGRTPASEVFGAIRAAGGFTQINHPTIFPNEVAPFASLCRGCSWGYSRAETDYSKVDAIEIATGPPGLRSPIEIGPNPFTLTAIDFYQRALAGGDRIAAVGVSDSHNAGRTNDPVTQAPVGTATTVLYAKELTERGIARAVRAGHTYVKVFGNAGPDLRFTARAGEQTAIIGDSLDARSAELKARVIGADPGLDLMRPGPYILLLLRDGSPVRVAPVTGDDQTFSFEATAPGRYQLQLMRGPGVAAYTSPIYLEP